MLSGGVEIILDQIIPEAPVGGGIKLSVQAPLPFVGLVFRTNPSVALW